MAKKVCPLYRPLLLPCAELCALRHCCQQRNTPTRLWIAINNKGLNTNPLVNKHTCLIFICEKYVSQQQSLYRCILRWVNTPREDGDSGLRRVLPVLKHDVQDGDSVGA